MCRLDGAYTPARYWNYLCRQLYVMDTYACAAARRTNHAMLMLHACLSWAFVAPAVLAALQGFVAAAWLLQVSLSLIAELFVGAPSRHAHVACLPVLGACGARHAGGAAELCGCCRRGAPSILFHCSWRHFRSPMVWPIQACSGEGLKSQHNLHT